MSAASTIDHQDPKPSRAKPTTSGLHLGDLLRRPEAGALIGTLGVFVFFAAFGGAEFRGSGGAASWLNVAAELGIIAIPVGLLMIAGELDLSVGSVLASSSMTLAIVSGHWGAPIIVGIAAALALGLVTGFINGLVVTRTNVPSFVVTLATNFGLAGLALGLTRAITGTTSVALTAPDWAKSVFGTLLADKFEVAIFWWLAVVVIVGWMLHVSKYGNWIFAVGGDQISARATGIPVQKVKIAMFMGSAFGAALVGVIQTILYNSAQVANGQSFVFNSIIAVVIGGVLLTGGYGSVIGVVLGTLTFSIVQQGIYYTGWNADWASLILGVLLLAAVLMNNTFRKMALASPSKKKKG
ncbi:Monosaccharide ABC transporter membrane protein, CUT2 family [metagenome]|uniref:Monosaccharide ABC transporter membrane protein, CUT2 family n=1 Tax=metagenome TaxID=256318 RepID=A0A2P2C6Y9_9ZZZZ